MSNMNYEIDRQSQEPFPIGEIPGIETKILMRQIIESIAEEIEDLSKSCSLNGVLHFTNGDVEQRLTLNADNVVAITQDEQAGYLARVTLREPSDLEIIVNNGTRKITEKPTTELLTPVNALREYLRSCSVTPKKAIYHKL
jgi:hypothetical protein